MPNPTCFLLYNRVTYFCLLFLLLLPKPDIAQECGGLTSILARFEKVSTTHSRPRVGIEEVDFTIVTNTGCTISSISDTNGLAALCYSCLDKACIIQPAKKDNSQNGITTCDLLLLSKHILGVENLDSPYKLIAADANNSSTITAADIIELRKLILGIYQKLPYNTSWRFVPKSFVFPNPANPFQTHFPEADTIYVTPGSPLPPVEFYGIKVGDVDGGALASVVSSTSVDRDAHSLSLGYAFPTGSQRGVPLEIPIFVQQATDVAAWQLALHYDTTQWQVKGVRWAMSAEPNLYQWADWHSPVPGELRLCWFDRMGAATHLAAQAPLAYLQVERRGHTSAAAPTALQLSPTMPDEAYSSSGQATPFALTAIAHYEAPPVIPRAAQPGKPEWTATAYPNPTDGQFRFEISLPVEGAGRIGLYDPMGRLVAQQDCTFTAGLNVVTSQQFPALQAGIYFVRFDTPLGRQTLRLVKK